MIESLPSQFTATCTFCNGVSNVTLTGVHDQLDVHCPRCGAHLGTVGALKKGNAAAERATSGTAVKDRGNG